MILTIFLIIFIVVPAIVLHEVSHGWVAYRLGDPTAKRMGRLSLNPLKHIDPIGTIVVPVALYLLYAFHLTSSLVMFGWAKPVPVNFPALSHPRRDKILVALAGPVMNLLIAFLFAQLARSGMFPVLSDFFYWSVLLNLALAFFNLIPIPPLDGARVVSGLIPQEWERAYSKCEPFGILIVIVLVNLRVLDFLDPLIYGTARWLGL